MMSLTKISNDEMNDEQSIQNIGISYPDIVQFQMEDYYEDLTVIIINADNIFSNQKNE